MSAVDSFDVMLPCGLLENGKLLTNAEIIPMTGKTRKVIARPDIRQNPAKVLDALLLQCVTKIGPFSTINKKITDRLSLGDRDFLVMEIRKKSLGDIVESVLECPSCKEKMDIKINLNNVTVKYLKETNFKIDGDKLSIDITCEKPKFTAKFRMPCGEDQHAIAPFIRKNPIEANYMLYQRCLLEWDGQNVFDLSPTFFEDLPLPILDILDIEFFEALPGPDMRLPANCIYCNTEINAGLESSDFLFRLPKREKI